MDALAAWTDERVDLVKRTVVPKGIPTDEFLLFVERFLSHVEVRPGDLCWRWLGARAGGTGYGVTTMARHTMGAHRAAFLLEYHYLPEGMEVCHRCNHKWCVRPDHLYPGTKSMNMRDCVESGQKNQARGERHARARLTWDAVRAIRARWAAGGARQTQLAAEFGVSAVTISNIVNGKIWRQV